jgi:protein tyrosine/serine phosphatase
VSATLGHILRWDGCVNVRDLGGLPTEGGGVTARGAVVRADSVGRLSDAGWAALVAYGVRRIVDLRSPGESAGEVRRLGAVEYVAAPLYPGDEPGDEEIWALWEEAASPAAAWAAVFGEWLRRYPGHVARAVVAVASAPDGAVVVHCAYGKDRTGLVAALLLRAVGVPLDAVADDYAASAVSYAALVEAHVAEGLDERERELRRRSLTAPAEAVATAFRALEQRHGSVAAYLGSAGVGEAALARLQARLRDERGAREIAT